ncbi:MAG: Methionyl-tRNA formyltransferase [Solirubrobacterales bacterium]|nr:Methionyl-tRNA formyltransferase [Solirubrobacterales bacterium]
MRTVFIGTSDFAVAVLERLAASAHRPTLVVTPVDRPRGRGRTLSSPPAAAAARELGIELLQTADASEPRSYDRIRAVEAEVGVVCAFGQLIREPLLSGAELLNVHPSLLPRWRGAAPIERAIMAGDEETGVTIMRVTEGLDSGPVALQEAVTIGDDDHGTLAARLATLGGELAVRALDLRAVGELELTDQEGAAATYAEKIDAGERRLDPARPAFELERAVRALTPHIGAHLELADGGRLGILRVAAEPGQLAQGAIAADGGLRLGCREGILRLLRVRPAGGREMDAEAYLRGHPAPRPG